MLSLVFKLMIQILLHIICNMMVILTGAIDATDFLDYFISEPVYYICFFANIIFYQVYVYLNYKIGELKKFGYKIIYWVFDLVCLVATLCLWLPGIVN